MTLGHGFGPSKRRLASGGASAVLAGYAWAADFRNGNYRQGAQLVTSVKALSGCNFTRTGSVNEQLPGSAVHSFASGVPALVPGYGYVQRTSHSNLLLNAGQASVLTSQTVTLTASLSYTLSFIGTGSIAISGVATGQLDGTGVNNRVRLSIMAGSAGAAAFTVTGDVRWAGLVAATTQGPIIQTGASTATAPAGDLWFVPPDLSGDWLLLADLDFLETNAAAGIEEAVLSINDGSNANRIFISRAAGGGQIRARRNIAGGPIVIAADPTVLQTEPGQCILGLRKIGDTYTLGVAGAGANYSAASLGTLTGWSAPFSRLDVGKQLSFNISQTVFRFVGLEAAAIGDAEMQARLEARL